MAKYLETKNIPVAQIELAPWHPRKNINQAHIEEIGGSLTETYQMSSIRVTPRDGKYIVAFGGRRVTGAKIKGLQDIRAEIWELTDLELVNDQARELFHTESLDGSPDWDNFVLYAFEQNVEERISLRNVRNDIHCPRCYECPRQKIKEGAQGQCPAFLSQTEFADDIIGNVSHDTIRLALARAQLRQIIPGLAGLELAGYLINILARLYPKPLDAQETLALAKKVHTSRFCNISKNQKQAGYRSGTRDSLSLIALYLQAPDIPQQVKDKLNLFVAIPKSVRDKLIYQEDFGPAEAEDILKRLESKSKHIEYNPNSYCRIIAGDISEWEAKNAFDIEPQSIAAIITDPPYSKEYLPTYEHLATMAKYLLKPNGSLFVMIGQSYLFAIGDILSKHLDYHWELCYLTPGGQAPHLWAKNVNAFWKPILWFNKGTYGGDCVGDVIESHVNDNDKDFHDWGQSESGMADLIEKVTHPGDLILDPFMGGATTGAVALPTGRGFIGLDNSLDAIKTAMVRLGVKDYDNYL